MKETRFKQTEIGLIPEDWSYGNFADFLKTFTTGATPLRSIKSYYEGNIKWVSSGELNYRTIYDTVEHITEFAARNTNLKIHEKGTFLMAITGLEAEGTRGKCAILGTEATTNQSCLAINSTPKMTIEYLYYYYRLNSDLLAFKYCQGSKQQSYTAEIVKKLPIYCPKEILEQNKIASALTSIDNLLLSLDKQIEKKRLIKQGAMQELLTGKKRLPGFTGAWVERRLGELLTVKHGYPFKSEEYQRRGDFLIVTISNVQDGYFEWGVGNYIDNIPYNLQKHQKLEIGDILVSLTGNIGRICKVDRKNCLLNQRVGVLKFTNDKLIDFIYYRLQYTDFIYSLYAQSKGVAQQNIGSTEIEDFKFYMPSDINEVKTISSIIKKIEADIITIEKKKAKYEQIKQGMMQQLLTGKIRLIS